mmetsp:Transcript_29549/g.42188  ORF Transcript_29549/g.42188 Transcript_29549/m.42188 type:complete len:392 (-) Transcript_29549:743-1918(-)
MLQAQEGLTPLILAATKGHSEVVSILLENGASVKATTKNGSTPLHRAAYEGHVKVVNILLNNRSPMEVTTENGSTPLILAALAGRSEVVSVLLARGALIEAAEKNGNRALHLAARRGHSEVASLLLASGAQKSVTNKEGKTACQVAQENGRTAALQKAEDSLKDRQPHVKDIVAEFSRSRDSIKATARPTTLKASSNDNTSLPGKASSSAPPKESVATYQKGEKTPLSLIDETRNKGTVVERKKATGDTELVASSSLKNAANSSIVTASDKTSWENTVSYSAMDYNSSSSTALSTPFPSSGPVNEILDPFLKQNVDYFKDFNDISNNMSVDELIQNLMELKTDVFLSHDWGVHGANHRRVAQINEELKAAGLVTWFDEVRLHRCNKYIACA